MSLSLTLVIERPSRAPQTIPARNTLDYGYVTDELHALMLPVSVPLPEGIEYADDEEGRKLQHEDQYGAPLSYVPAALLVPRLREHARSPWELAIVTFIEKLPPSTRVVLWWH
ncbi:hypothetical protein AB4Y45_35485 [Paraburkholderia sp. EG287A]|uniref:hypothetical protein n=1 Tax=Paraburkholderia sp. EG287A TaxID=3237012 RepID=UPI0034D2B226